jgi:hypothetical protein
MHGDMTPATRQQQAELQQQQQTCIGLLVAANMGEAQPAHLPLDVQCRRLLLAHGLAEPHQVTPGASSHSDGAPDLHGGGSHQAQLGRGGQAGPPQCGGPAGQLGAPSCLPALPPGAQRPLWAPAGARGSTAFPAEQRRAGTAGGHRTSEDAQTAPAPQAAPPLPPANERVPASAAPPQITSSHPKQQHRCQGQQEVLQSTDRASGPHPPSRCRHRCPPPPSDRHLRSNRPRHSSMHHGSWTSNLQLQECRGSAQRLPAQWGKMKRRRGEEDQEPMLFE